MYLSLLCSGLAAAGWTDIHADGCGVHTELASQEFAPHIRLNEYTTAFSSLWKTAKSRCPLAFCRKREAESQSGTYQVWWLTCQNRTGGLVRMSAGVAFQGTTLRLSD